MPRSLILHWYRNLLEPFRDALAQAGIETAEGDPNHPHEATAEPGTHLIWGCPSTMIDADGGLWEMLRARDDVWFAEQGWFPQKGNFYIDHQGPNGFSSIRGAAPGLRLTDADERELDRRIAEFHGPIQAADDGYIFVPLQVEIDSNISRWSHIPACEHRVKWFFEKVCRAFPDQKMVFRSHPLERRMDGRFKKFLPEFPNAELINEGTSLEWAARAKAVVGINSTCLLEALTFNKPVLAFGENVFSDNGAVLEVRGDVSRLREILAYEPDPAAIRRLLFLLFQRQIPVAVEPTNFHRHPVLAEMLAQVRSGLSVVNPSPRPPAGGTDVYAFLEYLDIPGPGIPRIVSAIEQPDVRGLLLNDFVLEDFHGAIGEFCDGRGVECIPMFTEDLQYPHFRRLARAKEFGGKICLGNNQTHEWTGGMREAQTYIKFAEAQGFEWVCPLTHASLCRDILNGGRLRAALKAANVQVFCLCGNTLIGYLFDEPRMPGMMGTSLTGHNLHLEFGLTIERMQEYCDGLRIYTGAGGAPGLALGSRRYTQQLGFRGILCWLPFDLDGSMEIAVKPPPAEYPQSVCGIETSIGDDFRRKQEQRV